MSGKLDQSLDQIMQDGGSKGARRNARPRTNRRAAQKAKAAIAAPFGGVSKSAKAPKAPAMAAPRRPISTGDSKIIINGLPLDVPEKDLKDYISKTVAPPKRVMITYGPDGRSRGIATVIFADSTSSTRAAKLLDNIKIDGRLIKVEHVLSDAPAVVAPKTLADRMSKPKNAAKEATKAAPKGKAAVVPATNGAAKKEAGKGKKSGRAGRPKKKTADELDAEMMDYFGNESGAAATNGAAAPAAPAAATNGAVPEPVDEVM